MTADEIIDFIDLATDEKGQDEACEENPDCADCKYLPYCEDGSIINFLKELRPFMVGVKNLRSVMESQEREIEGYKSATKDIDLRIIQLEGELEHCRSENSRLVRAVKALTQDSYLPPL